MRVGSVGAGPALLRPAAARPPARGPPPPLLPPDEAYLFTVGSVLSPALQTPPWCTSSPWLAWPGATRQPGRSWASCERYRRCWSRCERWAVLALGALPAGPAKPRAGADHTWNCLPLCCLSCGIGVHWRRDRLLVSGASASTPTLAAPRQALPSKLSPCAGALAGLSRHASCPSYYPPDVPSHVSSYARPPRLAPTPTTNALCPSICCSTWAATACSATAASP